MSVLQARELRRAFGKGAARVEALRGVTLSVSSGHLVAVMGPSGAGKSALLHLLGGLDRPTSGTVLLDGTDLATLSDESLTLLRRRRIGFVFQAFNLVHAFSAEENVALPLVADGRSSKEAKSRARAALDRVGLADRASHRPGELSGGEQQRVAVARALVADPVLILADEPTGNLDSASGEAVMDLLRDLVEREKKTLVLVTHNPRDASYANRLVHLRDGTIAGTHDLPPRCSPAQVMDLLGASI